MRFVIVFLLAALVLLEGSQTVAILDNKNQLKGLDDRVAALEAPPPDAWRDIAIDTTIPYTPPVWPRPVISLKYGTLTRCDICRQPAGHEGSITLVLEHKPGTRIFEEIKRHKGIKKIEARENRAARVVCKECASTLVDTIYIITMEDKANDGA
jgi:hypothetical protein